MTAMATASSLPQRNPTNLTSPQHVRGFLVHSDGTIQGPSGKTLKPAEVSGYLCVARCIPGGGIRWEGVKRLVCEGYHGPAPEGKPYVAVLNENNADVRAENVCWASLAEIAARRRPVQARQGQGNPSAKLTAAQVRSIRSSPGTNRDLSIKFGVSDATISRVRAGITWRSVA